MIPYGTDRALKRPTVTTYWLIGVNVVVFLVGAVMERRTPGAYAVWYDALSLDPNHFRWWGLFSYQFLHAGFMHLAGNMVFLWVFGANVEDKLGRWWYVVFYLLGGAAAGGAHCLFERPIAVAEDIQIIPGVVGASGAIAAITGAYMVFFPRTMVRVLCFIVFIGTFHIPAWWLIAGAIVKDLFFHGLGADQGVALMAHLGGYAFGIGLSFILLARCLLPREDFDLFSLVKQAKRRREFRELTTSGSSAWLADAASGKTIPKPAPKAHATAEESRVLELRGQIGRLMAKNNLPAAASAYLRLLDETGEAVMSRDAQAALGNHFFVTEQWQHSAVAFDLFVKKFPGDREAPRIRLLLALINARYLNDPVRAKALLRELGSAGLAEEHRALAATLEREIG